MSSIFIFLFIVFLIKKLKSDTRGSDFGKLLRLFLILAMVFGGIGPIVSTGAVLAGILGIVSAVALPIGILAFLLYKYVIKQEAEERSQKYGWDEKTKKTMKERETVREKERKVSTASEPLTSKILPRPVGRRKKLISTFNTKYTLRLTEEQVKRIADASYFSRAWKEEVEAMAKKYDAVYQWFQGDTAYLRAYLYVFPVQDVTSDFAQQQQICVDSFEEVFAYADSFPELNIDGRIEKINSKFFTNFDEVTYMIAFRFLEQNGYHHRLDRVELNKKDADIDDLLLKYQRQEQGVGGV